MFRHRAAAFQFPHRCALELGECCSVISMGRDPAAVNHRPVGDGDEAALMLADAGDGPALGDAAQEVRNVLIAVAGEASDPDAMVKEFAKRNAGPGHLRVN